MLHALRRRGLPNLLVPFEPELLWRRRIWMWIGPPTPTPAGSEREKPEEISGTTPSRQQNFCMRQISLRFIIFDSRIVCIAGWFVFGCTLSMWTRRRQMEAMTAQGTKHEMRRTRKRKNEKEELRCAACCRSRRRFLSVCRMGGLRRNPPSQLPRRLLIVKVGNELRGHVPRSPNPYK